ncbi:hypothetical protein EIP91_003990 [Steccherinum ochraceum]|uniref:Cep57 centrosome microtubule-binding domain-containing protein n=1 Tax=Steccherinum ochraceum TaxID=92696 RepID=A0A4R0RCV4_9APHY|nr:hypothetical protein EIP91_003990 [Steccherinum ochraceum]
MSRRGSTIDFSIIGDALEEHRIQLEQNLQQTDISLHLSSPRNDYSDVENPRHLSDPYSFSGIASFDRSREALESPSHRPWSYRAMDEDEGYNTYAGETISTAAHHASALTLSAGLGGRAGRRDVSLSGAEYDPDRPVQNIMAGMSRKGVGKSFSYSGKAKQTSTTTVDFDPLVVDDTAEIDQLFHTSGLQSPPLSAGSASPGQNDAIKSPRPKLSDALHRVTFSPKRPRSAQATPRSARSAKRNDPSFSVASASARDRTHQSLSYATIRPPLVDEPTVNVLPPTPSPQTKGRPDTERNHPKYPTSRVPSKAKVYPASKSFSKSKVHLPDVTGLTSAVGSPSKLGIGYFAYEGNGDSEIEARLVATLSVVQSKLAYLEAENGISRRRVRELELELEECKKEVVRERTRMLDQDVSSHTLRNAAGVAGRYKEAVEEKKALEDLISSLRTHLARLTAELSEHRQLLTELRSLRDQDVAALQEKSRDINRLKEEVERLSGEVEVLRGVVEEGLKERREVRERSMEESSLLSEEDQTSHLEEEDRRRSRRSPSVEDDDAETSSESNEASHLRTPTAAHHSLHPSTEVDVQPEPEPEHSQSRPYIEPDELDMISLEVEERRSERSLSRSVGSTSRYRESKSQHHSPLQSAPKSFAQSARATSSSAPTNKQPNAPLHTVVEQPSRSSTPRHDPPRADPVNHQPGSRAGSPDAPFPQIRGTRMERLFFAAPQHNSQTSDLPVEFLRVSDQRDHVDAARPSIGPKHQPFAWSGDGLAEDRLPPQTVLTRVLRELEDDFTHYKAIYVELADQYKVIDAVSNVAKRNVLAQHVHEIVDILEQKGDQIASLYQLLSYRDQPLPSAATAP